jgi:hypothetical protein
MQRAARWLPAAVHPLAGWLCFILIGLIGGSS